MTLARSMQLALDPHMHMPISRDTTAGLANVGSVLRHFAGRPRMHIRLATCAGYAPWVPPRQRTCVKYFMQQGNASAVKACVRFVEQMMCCLPCGMCHVSCITRHASCITCHVSRVICHVSCVTCHVSWVMRHVPCVTRYASCARVHVSIPPAAQSQLQLLSACLSRMRWR